MFIYFNLRVGKIGGSGVVLGVSKFLSLALGRIKANDHKRSSLKYHFKQGHFLFGPKMYQVVIPEVCFIKDV